MVFFNDINSNIKKNNNVHEISFKLVNIHTGLANSIRRCILTEIPNIAFSDDEQNSSITIHKNTSALHNEFLAHRISLLPICIINNPMIKIKTYWDNIKQLRKYDFSNPEKIPIFVLNQSNNAETDTNIFGNTEIKEIYTNHFEFLNPEHFPDKTVTDFFPKDLITDDYILINKLKPSFNEKIGESINMTCKLTIGTARENTRYCPVGTVSYSFEQQSSEEIEENFNKYIKYLQNERRDKKLQEYTDKEIKGIHQSYLNLDAYRVYKKDDRGNANSILFNIETIGGMNPYTIMYDSLNILFLKLEDILKCIVYSKSEDDINLKMTDKLKINKINKNVYDIHIDNEDHTIGNLLSYYMKYLYLDGIVSSIIKIVSYKMPHPLENKIIIRVHLLDTIDLSHCLKCTHMTNTVIDSDGKRVSEQDIENLKHKDKWVVMELFQLAIMYIMNILDKLKIEWVSKTPTENTSFDIIDMSFIKKNIPIDIIHEHLKHVDDTNYTPPPIIQAIEPPPSPEYQPVSPEYQPESPAYQPVSPAYQPVSPEYQPVSPEYQPVTPS